MEARGSAHSPTPLMTADEVAAILRLPSRRSVYSLVDQGLLPYVSVGRHLRFSEDHLAELYRRSAEAAS